MVDTKAFEIQKSLILDDLEDINDDKISGIIKIQDIFKKLKYESKFYDLFEIAYRNSDNRMNAEKEMNSFIKKLGETVLIKTAFVVIQFLTSIAEEKYKEMEEIYDKAIKKIALIQTKDNVKCGLSTKFYDLVPVINKSDSFDKWSLDPLFGHLKIVLILEDKREFPDTWRLNENSNLVIKKEDLYRKDFHSDIEDNQSINVNIRSFLSKLFLQSSKIEIDFLERKLNELGIFGINNLKDLDSEGWKILKSKFPSHTEKLKDGVERINQSVIQQKNKSESKTRNQQLNDWHKVKRFLFYKSDMNDQLNKTAFLDGNSLKACFDDQKNGLINELKFGNKLDELYDALKPFTLEDYKNTNEHTGLLLHGPPGSGKTKIMEMILNISGLTPLVKPISSSEINKSLVGESENILRDIFNRALEFPYLLCVILVDEIDTFAPDRKKDNQQAGKSENVNQLLALMDGVTPVPNNYVIGATNFYNKIDEAFLRRLKKKIFVPNLDAKQRLEIFQSLATDEKILDAFLHFLEFENSWKINYTLQNLLKTLTINFSAAATGELKEKIRSEILFGIRENPDFRITTENIIDYADSIANQQNIKISSFTIPSFVKNKNEYPSVKKFININFTGRVLIDLTPKVRNVQFELKNKELHILDLKKYSYVNVNQLIPMLLQFTIEQELNFIQLLDSTFSVKNNKATSESSAESILNFICYFEHYDQGVLLFDGDSLVGTSISGQTQIRFDLEKFSRSLTDSNTYQKGLLTIFNGNISNKSETPKKWYFFVTSSDFMVDRFKRDICFPLTTEETERENKENQNRLEEKKCLNCSKTYIEDDNNLDSCSFHTGQLICCTPGLKYGESVTKEELIAIARDRLTQDIFKEFKYHCCMKPYDSEGCEKGKHNNVISFVNQPIKKIEKLVTLRSKTNQKLVTINKYGELFAKKGKSGLRGYESFYLIYHNSSTVSIKSILSDSFICTTRGGVLNGNNNAESGQYGKFTIIQNNSDGTYSFKSCFNSHYISAHNEISPLTARTFSREYLSNYSFYLTYI